MAMRVFILGAGFSCDAGYPLTNKLMVELDDYVQNDEQGQKYKHPWELFKKWQDQQIALGGRQADICATQNPEYILTYLDIAIMAVHDIDENAVAPEETVRFSLQQVMSRYFDSRHFRDRDTEPAHGDKYSEFFNSYIQDDDVIITFNYDTLAERFLLGFGKWCPGDGYGFRPNLERESLRASISKPTSTVKILKLHGSVGWHSGGYFPRDEVTLTNSLLVGFGLMDDTGSNWDDASNPALLAPSFVKTFKHMELYNLWSQAAQALRDAEDVVIIGYSLPEADGAAVALVTGALRHRKTPVLVVDPTADDLRERYELATNGRVWIENKCFAQWAGENFKVPPPFERSSYEQ